jgi:hypothetical protein
VTTYIKPTPQSNRWTPHEDAMLFIMKEQKMSVAIIAERLDRTKSAVHERYYLVRRQRGLSPMPNGRPRRDAVPPKAADPVVRAKPPVAAKAIILQAAAPSTPSRAVKTSTLVADSELRARIEMVGITAGLLGDPLPGRSALDQMRKALA